jgi:hypothetical protein
MECPRGLSADRHPRLATTFYALCSPAGVPASDTSQPRVQLLEPTRLMRVGDD